MYLPNVLLIQLGSVNASGSVNTLNTLDSNAFHVFNESDNYLSDSLKTLSTLASNWFNVFNESD